MSGRTPDHIVNVPLNLQEWHSTTFVHWSTEAAAVQPHLPPGLDVDTFDGAAWIGIVPFVMRRVRLPGVPVPLVRDFVEVNVRTYVRGPDGNDGLWFFSLDCDRLPAVLALRSLGLPYVRARAAIRGDATAKVDYASRRHRGRGACVVHTAVGRRLPEPDARTLFLTGRWNAYVWRARRLWRIPVEHEPWPLHEARAEANAAGLLQANGLPLVDATPLAHYAPVVHVRIGAPRRA